MRGYIVELFDGHYDQDYVNSRLRIGKVHKRIGVSPKLYVSAMWILENSIVEVLEAASDEEIAPQTKQKVKYLLGKILSLDTQFVFDTYIASLVDEVRLAKDEVSQYASSLEDAVASRTSELERLSVEDNLTQLFNQRYFYEALRRELNSGQRNALSLSLLYVDIDNFKHLNDEKGHLAGDKVLQKLGKAMKRVTKKTDFACRYGGDEFCLILTNTHKEGALKLADKLIKSFETINHESGIGLSIGCTTTGPTNFVSYEHFVRLADAAMYKAKQSSHENGKSNTCYIDKIGNVETADVRHISDKIKSTK